MNEQDKEAFEKWFRDYWSFEHINKIDCLKSWQAACEYKEDEFKFQTPPAVVTYMEINDKLLAENKKLREVLEFYAKTESWDADGVICDDNYAPWGEQGIEVGGRRAVEALAKYKDQT
jgi:hypothetical protein